jgi:hypothetical protein
MSEEKQPRKASSVRHTRAIQRDHTKHPISAPTAEEIQERLTEIVHPATLAQVNYFHSLGLRERTLSLMVMVAFVLGMIWRQISGVVSETERRQSAGNTTNIYIGGDVKGGTIIAGDENEVKK